MNIDIINSGVRHAKSLVDEFRLSNKLPFTDILSSETINEKMQEICYRTRIFTPEVTLFAFLAQVMNADQSCQAAVAQVIAHFVTLQMKEISSNTAAYCKARQRLPEELLSSLAKESAELLETQAESSWLWRNRHVKMPDGTTVSMPDTPENQAMYPQPRSQKKRLDFRLRVWWVFFLFQRVRCLIWQLHRGPGKVLVNMHYFEN